MFIRSTTQNRSGWTLVEAMVAIGVFSIASVALALLFLFCTRSFAAMTNYAVLDKANRQAMDQFTSEIRQARSITDYTTNANSSSISFISGVTGGQVTYLFTKTNQQVRRIDDNGGKTLLTNCSVLNFELDMRPGPADGFDYYPTKATNNWQQTVKLVRLTWRTVMQINPTPQINSEDIQTACVVMRNQH